MRKPVYSHLYDSGIYFPNYDMCFHSTLSSKSKIAQICQDSQYHEQKYQYLSS